MGFFRRDGRVRPGTLWALFVVALLLGAAVGWGYRWWTERTLHDHAVEAEQRLQRSVDQLTK